MQEQEFRKIIEKQPYQRKPHGAVLNQQEFLQDFGSEARVADEVFSAVMHLEAGQVGSQVVDIFTNAPTKGKKTIVIDAFSQLVAGGLVLAPNKFIPFLKGEVQNRQQDQDNLLSQLEETGTEVRITNTPKGIKDKLFPYTGRSHLKISYVVRQDGQKVAYIHSNNYLDAPSAEIVVKFTGSHAEKIIDTYNHVINKPPQEDYEQQLTDDLWVFVDGGKPGKSIILDKGIELTQAAEQSIQVCSQLPPTGVFAEALTDAHRDGKLVEVVSTKRYPDRPLYSDNNIMYLVYKSALADNQLHGYDYPLYFDPYRNMHAKLLLKDALTENAVADFGSHNYAESGVKAGTVEVQLRSTDKAIVGALHRRFLDFKLVATH